MRRSFALLTAAVCLTLGMSAPVLAAEIGGGSSPAPLSSACQCGLSAGDSSTQLAQAQSAPASNDDPDHPSDPGSASGGNVDVASSLANRLSIQDRSQPEVIGTPQGDATISDSPLFDGASSNGVAGCPPPCCPCPSWTFSVGTIFLNQSDPGHSPVLNRLPPPPPINQLDPPIQRANLFSPGLRFGYELDAIRHNVGGSAWDVEARYFGINRWTSTLPTIEPHGAGGTIPFITPVYIARPHDMVTTTYQSLLQNVELNGRRNLNPWLQLIAGVRYVGFDDFVNYAVSPTIGATRFSSVSTRNNLIGPQTGANVFLWQGRRFGVQAFGKGGIYGNAASTDISVTRANGSTLGATANGGHVSFLGEIGLTTTYRLTQNWSIRTTYEMLWLDGVARAPDQIAVSNPAAGMANVSPDGSLFFYGGFFGLQYNR